MHAGVGGDDVGDGDTRVGVDPDEQDEVGADRQGGCGGAEVTAQSCLDVGVERSRVRDVPAHRCESDREQDEEDGRDEEEQRGADVLAGGGHDRQQAGHGAQRCSGGHDHQDDGEDSKPAVEELVLI